MDVVRDVLNRIRDKKFLLDVDNVILDYVLKIIVFLSIIKNFLSKLII